MLLFMHAGAWLADPTFVPCVLVTKVLPIPRCEKVLGAFTSYQSFLANGSTLQSEDKAALHVRDEITM